MYLTAGALFSSFTSRRVEPTQQEGENDLFFHVVQSRRLSVSRFASTGLTNYHTVNNAPRIFISCTRFLKLIYCGMKWSLHFLANSFFFLLLNLVSRNNAPPGQVTVWEPNQQITCSCFLGGRSFPVVFYFSISLFRSYSHQSECR